MPEVLPSVMARQGQHLYRSLVKSEFTRTVQASPRQLEISAPTTVWY